MGRGAGEADTLLGAAALKLKDAKAFLDGLPRGEMGAPTVDSVSREGDLEPSVSLGPFQKLSLNLRGALSARILNGPEDEDEDGVAGSPDAPTGSNLSPQLELSKNGDTWVKYRVEAGIKASGAAALSALDFEFEGAAEAVLLDYRAHPRDEKVLLAVASDLSAGPRTAFDLAHVLAQGEADSLAVRLRGKLRASATLSWSDVFTSQLGNVLSATGVKTAVGLKLAAGASVTGSIALVDDFVVVFTRLPTAAWRVAVRKARERRLGLGATAGVTVAFAQPQQIQALVASYLAGLLGGPVAEVKKLLGKASLESLKPAERTLVATLLERFGIDDVPERLALLKEKIEAAEEAATDAIERAAKAKLEVGFAYEYNRLDTKAVLLEAELNEAALRAHHGDLVWGRMDGALAQEGPSVKVRRYLNEQTSTRTRSYGFSLGLDKWKISGMDVNKLEKVERRDADGHIQRSYKGLRAYKGKWISKSWSWEVDFSAAMPSFSAAPGKARVSEFDCGLSVLWHQASKKLKDDDVEELLDTASLWQIVDRSGLADARRLLEGALGKPYEATLHLLLGPGAFWDVRSLLGDPSQPSAPSMAEALAAAMPWWKKIRPMAPAERRATFAPLWDFHLTHPDTSLDVLRHVVQARLAPELAFVEKSASRTHTFLGLVELNGNTAAAFARFSRGMRSLDEAVRNGEFDDDRLPAVFGDLRAFFAQSHHVRALGAYLLDAAFRRGGVAGVKRSLSLQPTTSSSAATIVIAPPT